MQDFHIIWIKYVYQTCFEESSLPASPIFGRVYVSCRGAKLIHGESSAVHAKIKPLRTMWQKPRLDKRYFSACQ
jgi:hypothetical protein